MHHNICEVIKLKKKGKMATLTLAAAGMGVGAWMMYKKKNPNAICDMKKMAKDMAYKVAYSLEEFE